MAAPVNTQSNSPFLWLADVGSSPLMAGATSLASTSGTDPVRRLAAAVPFGDLLKVMSGIDAGGDGTSLNTAAPKADKASHDATGKSTVHSGLAGQSGDKDKAQSPVTKAGSLADLATHDWSGLPWLEPHTIAAVALIGPGATPSATPAFDQQTGSPVSEVKSGSTSARNASASSGMDADAANHDMNPGWHGRSRRSMSLPETLSLPPGQLQPVPASLVAMSLPLADSAGLNAVGRKNAEFRSVDDVPAGHFAEAVRGSKANAPADSKPVGGSLPGDSSKPTNPHFLEQDHDKSLFRSGHAQPALFTADEREFSGSPHLNADRSSEQVKEPVMNSRPQVAGPETERKHTLRQSWSSKPVQQPDATATAVSPTLVAIPSGPVTRDVPNSWQGSTSGTPAVNDSIRESVHVSRPTAEFNETSDPVSPAWEAPAVRTGQEFAARHSVAGFAAMTQNVSPVKTLADQTFKAISQEKKTASDTWAGASLAGYEVSGLASVVPIAAQQSKAQTAGNDQPQGTRFMIDQQPDPGWGVPEDDFPLMGSPSSWSDQLGLVAARTAKAPAPTATGLADLVSVPKGNPSSALAAVTPHEVLPESIQRGADSPALPHTPPRVFTVHTPLSVAGQILSVAGETETGWVTVSLHPADIGPLKIRVDREANSLSAEIFAGDPNTLVWLDQNRELLLDALRGQGLALDSLSLAAGPAGGESGSLDQRTPPGESPLQADGQPVPGLSRNGAHSASWKTGTPGILPGLIDLVA
jgi:flagellar hook-length control protein FliK